MLVTNMVSLTLANLYNHIASCEKIVGNTYKDM
jgi:hypothetical protein